MNTKFKKTADILQDFHKSYNLILECKVQKLSTDEKKKIKAEKFSALLYTYGW